MTLRSSPARRPPGTPRPAFPAACAAPRTALPGLLAALLVFLVFLVFLGLPALAGAQDLAEGVEPPPGYGVRTGDEVTLEFYTSAGEEVGVISGTRRVDRNGRVYLPFLGSVEVVGMDAETIRERLEVLYGAFYTDPVVDVTVALRVNVTGAVNSPGNYFLNPSSTIVDAVAEAGGTGLDIAVANNQVPADPSAVRLIRGDSTTILDLRPDEADSEVLGMPIQSGDWIFVPPRGRSRVRDEILFWGSVVSFVSGVVGLGILIAR